MLFPRYNSSKNNGDQTQESLLGYRHSVSVEIGTFEEGYPAHEQPQQHQTTKARRHHSTGSTFALNGGLPRCIANGSRTTRAPLDNNSFISDQNHHCNNTSAMDQAPLSANLNRRSATFPPQQQQRSARRSGTTAPRPKRLSLDHASYIATYPSLDGLGDLGRTSSLEYFADPCYAAPLPRRSGSSNSNNNRVRKQTSQDTLSASRSSTSSISSMVSDISTSSSTLTSSSVREPLTPTNRSPNYKSIDNHTKRSSSSSSRKSVHLTSFDDLLEDSNNNNNNSGSKDHVHAGHLCLSPQSNNFFEEENGQFVIIAKSTEARGQRQMIAH
ncbi:hypothetical protein BGZ83_008023 [Gryganskiella cystojenkinii]|nr:hypothetical protein BGZ83_008023 [Gryganskiella cystojenkinii]